MTDLSKLSDDDLEAEHDARVEAVHKARDAYAANHDDKHGRALLKAREAASESQTERNARHGAPPAQSIGN